MATSPTTLPASWYTSKAFYNLERRAVFLKVRLNARGPNPSGNLTTLVMDGPWQRHPLAKCGGGLSRRDGPSEIHC
jgi:hypothetical protein